MAWRQARLLAKTADASRPGCVILYGYPARELLDRSVVWNAFDLDQIRAGMSELRIRQYVLELPIVREKQQAFAIAIETAARVHARHFDRVLQREPVLSRFAGELAQDVEWLIECNVPVRHALSAHV